jgi:hypothetical protein
MEDTGFSAEADSALAPQNNDSICMIADSALEILTAVSGDRLLTLVPPPPQSSPADWTSDRESPIPDSAPSPVADSDSPEIECDESSVQNAASRDEEQISDALRQADERFGADLAQLAASLAESAGREVAISESPIDTTESPDTEPVILKSPLDTESEPDFPQSPLAFMEFTYSEADVSESPIVHTESTDDTPELRPRRNSRIQRLAPDNRGRSTIRLPGVAAAFQPTPATTARCQEALTQFQRSGAIPDYNERDPILKYIQRCGIEAVLSHNYPEAENMHRLYARFLEGMVMADRSEFLASRDRSMEMKMQNVRSDVVTQREEWQARVDDLKEVMANRLDQLKANHRRQLSSFESHFDEIESLRGFSKPSDVLVQLRSQERALVLCNRFKEARAIQKEARSREVVEQKRCQRWAETSVLRRRGNLVAKQEREIETATKFYERLITTTRTHMEQAMAVTRIRRNFLERESRAFAVYVNDLGGGGEAPGLASPRTKDKLYGFRMTEPLKPLPLVPLSGLEKKCSKSLLKRPESRRRSLK